jgi:hypothetical protein
VPIVAGDVKRLDRTGTVQGAVQVDGRADQPQVSEGLRDATTLVM